MNRSYALPLNKEIICSRSASAAIGVLFFILATALGAYIRIPVKGTPVPITLQTFFVILAGAVLGKRMGGFAQLGYIIFGMAGLPLFQGFGAGSAYVLGPTGGYLLGFVIAAYLIGRMTEAKNRSIYWVAVTFIIGDLVLLASGALWLMYLYKINIITAISIGILPFIPADAVKIFFAVVIYSKISKRAKAVFSA